MSEYKCKIAEVFFDLCLEKSIYEITVKEIIGIVGCSRGTFYKYYQDIFDILNKAKQYILAYINDNIDYLYLINNEQDKILSILKVYKLNAKYLYIFLEKHLDIAFKDQLKKIMKNKLFECICNDKYFEIHFEFGFSGVLAVLNYWYLNNFKFDEEELIKEIRKIAFKGVLTDLF